MTELESMGSYPQKLRKVAFTNGSGTGKPQGFRPGELILTSSYSSPDVDIESDVRAVPEGNAKTQIFRGKVNRSDETVDELLFHVSGTIPYDSAPGGTRPTQADIVAAIKNSEFCGNPNCAFNPFDYTSLRKRLQPDGPVVREASPCPGTVRTLTRTVSLSGGIISLWRIIPGQRGFCRLIPSGLTKVILSGSSHCQVLSRLVTGSKPRLASWLVLVGKWSL
jgi:hypothetical protein